MKISYANISILFIVFICLIIDFSFKNWEKPDRVIEHDVHWYYAYLPSIFIYNDIKQEKSDYRFEDDYYLFWPTITADGKKVTKTTLGLSILYAPFFFVAHFYSLFSDYPANGFSEPYKIFLLLSTVFYLFVGLDFLKKILRKFGFSDMHIATTILLLGLGTNLLCYSSQSAPHTHVYNFCLFAIFIFYTIKWHRNPSLNYSIALGILFGLISLIRPSNSVVFLFFLFYEISDINEIKKRYSLFKEKYFLIITIVLVGFLIWIPQFLYWKISTGHFFFYSYTHEKFFFNNPKILEGLFSFRKGWLLYTPMMVFALSGIFMMDSELKKLRFPIVFFVLINIYIVFSWWCWWYGGTFGQRPMIESYAILAIPLCSFVKFISEKKIFYRVAFLFTVLFFIWLNIFQTFQFEYQSLHWDGMTKELYFKQFWKLDKIENFDKYVAGPDYKKAETDGKPAPEEPNQIHDYFNGKKEIGRITFQLKAFNNKYVCADGTLNNLVLANKEKASTWETFILIKFENNECAILAYNYRFLCSELGNKNEITSTREKVGPWETFTMINLNSNFIALRANNGKYMNTDEKSLQLFANSGFIGRNEKFELIPQ